jgi:hypothetical protein
MPTEAALVTIVALVDKFPGESFEPCLYWFLQASRFGRYSGSGTTSLDEDLREIKDATTQLQAVGSLLSRFSHDAPLDPEFFLADYVDSRFGRFLMYLLIYRNQALDWDERSHRIGFEGVDLLTDFRPQWHHIFPVKFLEATMPEDKINALANIAVIGPEINIRISAQNPMSYIERYKITPVKLEQQFIDVDIAKLPIEGYENWLAGRAARLSSAGNQFLQSLKPALAG